MRRKRKKKKVLEEPRLKFEVKFKNGQIDDLHDILLDYLEQAIDEYQQQKAEKLLEHLITVNPTKYLRNPYYTYEKRY